MRRSTSRLACALGCGATALLTAAGAHAAMTPGDVARQVIVRFDPGTSAADRADAVDAVDPTASRALTGLSRTRVVTLPVGASRVDAMAELRADPAVTWVQPNRIRRISVVPSDPLFGDLWAFSTSATGVGAQAAWDVTTGSPDIGVAVVDSGIDPQHPDLVANLRSGDSRNFAESPGGGAPDPALWADANGHGSHVAGIIGAVGNNGIGVTGVNWRTGLVAARAMQPDGSGSDDAIINAMGWAADHARVVNMSLGGAGASPGEAAAVAAHPGTLFVVAAGNSTSDNDAYPESPCVVPGDNLICVASTDSTGNLSWFSNWGATTVDLAAPGSDILSTIPTFTDYLPDPGFTSLTGTWTQARDGSAVGAPWWVRSLLDDGTPFADLVDATGATGGSHTWTLDSAPSGTISGDQCAMEFDVGSVPDTGAPGITIRLWMRDGSDAPGAWTLLEGAVNTSTGGIFQSYMYEASSLVGHSGVQMRVSVTGSATFGEPPANYRVGVMESLRCLTPPVGPGAYGVKSGTSMATPEVAGAAALLLAKNPSITVSQLRHALLSTVTPDSRLGGKVVTGGRLNLAAALAAVPAAAGPAPAAEPAPDAAPAATAAGGTSAAAGTVLATTRDGRRVNTPLTCKGAAGMRCRFDVVIQQRARKNGRLVWREWGVLRRVDVLAPWKGRKSVPLNAAARKVLKPGARARVSLAVMDLAADMKTATRTTRTALVLRRP